MYAIVDIETTGGNASTGAITEIAIILHNGIQEEARYQTLVNPRQDIPRYIVALTGITNQMVEHAPFFEDVAEEVHEKLQNRIFVAHNVNFDYSFIYHNLLQAGIAWQARKVCTVRYARKVIPGLPSYSLGNLCRSLSISNASRHRAMGDCEATATLWSQLIAHDAEGKHLASLTKGRSVESYMPTNLPAEAFTGLPYTPGVYYFRDKGRKIIYIGKARNLSYRVRSHFSNNSSSRRKQDFLRNIHYLEYKVCATEMMASILEELEIKKHWPLYNRSQKGVQRLYGVYSIFDQRGYMRLAVEKWKKNLPALYRCHKIDEGYSKARKLIEPFELQEELMFITASSSVKIISREKDTTVEEHNKKMKAAIEHLQNTQPTMLLCEDGCNEKGETMRVYYSIERGAFKGYYQTTAIETSSQDVLKHLVAHSDNEMVKGLLYRFAESNPSQILLGEETVVM